MAGFELGGWLPWIVAAGIVLGITLLLSASKALLDRRLAGRGPEKANDLVADLERRTSYHLHVPRSSTDASASGSARR